MPTPWPKAQEKSLNLLRKFRFFLAFGQGVVKLVKKKTPGTSHFLSIFSTITHPFEEEKKFIDKTKLIADQYECIQLFSNDAAFNYLLRKKSCTKYYFVWSATPNKVQQKFINELSSAKLIIKGGVKVVETGGRNPVQVLPYLKDAGIKVIHKCTSVRHALKAQDIGCDAVSVDGFECGGHPGEDDIPNMILLPRAADELEIPFVSSGGQADARSLVASIAMGADGMNMGTRFMCTTEAPIHQRVKDAIVAASELDTRLIMRPLRNTERVLNNKAVERVLAVEKERGSEIKFEDILEDVAGVYPKVMLEGEMDIGAWSCGMVAGLVHDIPTCKELIDRIMLEAEEIIQLRLKYMLEATA